MTRSHGSATPRPLVSSCGQLGREPGLVAVHQLGARLAEPDAIIDRPAFLRRQVGIIAGTAHRSGGDMGRNADDDGLQWISVRTAGRHTAGRVGTPLADPLGEYLDPSSREIVTHALAATASHIQGQATPPANLDATQDTSPRASGAPQPPSWNRPIEDYFEAKLPRNYVVGGALSRAGRLEPVQDRASMRAIAPYALGSVSSHSGRVATRRAPGDRPASWRWPR